MPVPCTDDQTTDPGENPRDSGLLGRIVVTAPHCYRTAEPTFHRNDIFQQFVVDYAANEDKIRKLYEKLEVETQKLDVLTFHYLRFTHC